MVFQHVLGIPAIDFYYEYQGWEFLNDFKLIKELKMRLDLLQKTGSYLLYHTLYETHILVSKLMNPGFIYHSAVARLACYLSSEFKSILLINRLLQTDDGISTWTERATNVPFELTNYAKFLQIDFSKLESRNKKILAANGATFGALLLRLY